MSFLGRTSYNLDLQRSFANASGDHNPLHVNNVFARRSGSGRVVVHGIHVFMWALEQLFLHGFLKTDTYDEAQITCKFKKPIFLEEDVELFHHGRSPNGSELFAIEKNGTALVRIVLAEKAKKNTTEYSEKNLKVNLGNLKIPLKLNLKSLVKKDIQIDFTSLNAVFLEESFPLLFMYLSHERLHSIAVLSSAVGMIAPGEHSLFTGLVLNFAPIIRKEKTGTLRIEKFNGRHNFLNMHFSGGGVSVDLEAVATPEPVRTPTEKQIKKLMCSRQYSAGTVLIIGGSRGIGAIAARILSAGNTKVIVTYRDGREEAKKLAQDPSIDFRFFDSFKSDVTSFVKTLPNDVSALLYFATPKIFFRRTQIFHHEQFASFRHCYLDTFKKVFTELRHHSPEFKRVLYPSTEEVEILQTKNAEYRQAKIAAEEMCQQMSEEFRTMVFKVPRLPKIITDQTSWPNQKSVKKKDIKYIISMIDALYF